MEFAQIILINIIFLPLLGAYLAFVGGRFISSSFAQIISSFLMLTSTIFSFYLFKKVIFDNQNLNLVLLEWIKIGTFKSVWALNVDSLTALMYVVVTSVSTVVHFYSIGYMSQDPSIPRFMAYLSLFTFFMLVLVSSADLLQLFFGWEGVGLCSYLLIGFWFDKDSANKAAIKAFLVNRIADCAFVIAIAAIYLNFNSINFSEIFSNIELVEKQKHLDLICTLLLLGAMGKSAQIFFHVWLPDAMEGPTPVSALIHAATMVTAGVFLIARLSPIFQHSNFALDIAIYVGVATAFMAATIALVQNDIKKIIAYSTCSQLGYMFFACGIGAYYAAIFHLFTHAFFKALLFLAAGNVIHANHHQQDINLMPENLYKKMPYTYGLMIIGSLALAGIIPLSGYFSKDLILELAASKNNNLGFLSYVFGVMVAFLTAFYSMRLLIKVFHNKNPSQDSHHQVNEVGNIMFLPLLFLSFGALFFGFFAQRIGIITPEFWHNSLVFNKNLSKIDELSFIIKSLPLFASLLGMFLSFVIYRANVAGMFVHTFSGLDKLFSNLYFFELIYQKLIINPYQVFANFVWQKIDIEFIDKYGPGGFSKIMQRCSEKLVKLQNGLIYNYVLMMVLMVITIVTYLVLQ